MAFFVRQAARIPATTARMAATRRTMATRFPSIGVTWVEDATGLACFGSVYIPRIMAASQSTILDARAMDRTLRRMADEILELNDGTDDLVIVGIQRRGVQLAARIVSGIFEKENVKVHSGALDITLYRDDLQTVGPRPVVGPTEIPVDIEGKCVVIVDDVLYTGRTIRAALDELADFG